MNTIGKEERKLIVNNPVAKEQSSMNIVANQNNYYGDDPLLNAYISMTENNNIEILKEKYNLIRHLIKQDILKGIIENKKVDRTVVYKKIFEQINDYIENKIDDKFIINNIIDDGYNSIIYSIVGIAILLEKYDQEGKYISINGNENLFCYISSTTLNIKYSSNIENRQTLIETEKFSRELEKKLNKITSINNFYNIYNFNQIQINNFEDSDMKFINDEIKYHVTTGIIPNLIKPLYGEKPECGARELIQNATDACKERKRESETKYREDYKGRIDINFNDELITIRDNGIGMNIKIIKENYFCVGNSTKNNSNGNLVGQFGIGSLASFLLGDEVFVRTRRYGENDVLEFNYTLSKSADNIIDVLKKQNEDFDFGTEITIRLNKDLKKTIKDTYGKLDDILKINEWYLTSEISIYVNGEKIESIDWDNSEWIEFKCEDNHFCAEFLYDKKDISTKIDLDKKIIYNGIPLAEKYSLNDNWRYYSSKIKVSPCINIKDIGNEKKMKINLERSKFTNSGELFYDLVYAIYKKELETLKTKVPILIDKDKLIGKNAYDGVLVNDIPIIYSSMGAALDSVYTRCNLYSNGIKKLVKLYNCNNIKFKDLDEEYAYIFDNKKITKSFIGDKLINVSTKNLYIYNEFIKEYFFCADNWSNGLKTEALKLIYNEYGSGLNIDTSLSPTKFWEQHNKNKHLLTDRIMPKIESGFCEVKERVFIKPNLIENIFKNNKKAVIECQDTLITNIVSFGKSFDNYYNEIFSDSLFIWRWNSES
ncbi:ATP-binding protein [Clostridium botulinum]|uniref:ATP-binding protein n=1 Tax=Clostridium botulinum TaxID=1491 RepID=UPI0022468DB5|nr:ATP-binding protein [Clostridium botulinum]UZP03735.1 ATP-binding protein [Clostridium botulinum]UZP07091.1 ATP-binding protein [Clostridium botulinum]UZP10473.1 ATP-binding protein [Clostridium botulinum]